MVSRESKSGIYDCTWTKNDFYATASAKEAISSALFLLFLVYTCFVFLRHKNKESTLGVKFHQIINELAYTHLFFFLGAILAHVLVPKGYPVFLIYLYVLSMAGESFAALKEK